MSPSCRPGILQRDHPVHAEIGQLDEEGRELRIPRFAFPGALLSLGALRVEAEKSQWPPPQTPSKSRRLPPCSLCVLLAGDLGRAALPPSLCSPSPISGMCK